MELRLLLLALRVLDPRRWRVRLAQLGGGFGWLLWVWYRAVRTSPHIDAARDARRADRRAAVRAKQMAQARRLRAQVDERLDTGSAA